MNTLQEVIGNEKTSGFHLYDMPSFSDLMNRAICMESEAGHLILRSLFLEGPCFLKLSLTLKCCGCFSLEIPTQCQIHNSIFHIK